MVEASEQAEQYRRMVRRVLTALGYEPTCGNFRLLNPLIDWRAAAKLMDQPPIRIALCHILDGNGKTVRCQGRPVVVARTIKANTESEAKKNLSRSSHVFVKWWDSDVPGKPGAGHDNEENHSSGERQEQAELEVEPGAAQRERVLAAIGDFMKSKARRHY